MTWTEATTSITKLGPRHPSSAAGYPSATQHRAVAEPAEKNTQEGQAHSTRENAHDQRTTKIGLSTSTTKLRSSPLAPAALRVPAVTPVTHSQTRRLALRSSPNAKMVSWKTRTTIDHRNSTAPTLMTTSRARHEHQLRPRSDPAALAQRILHRSNDAFLHQRMAIQERFS